MAMCGIHHLPFPADIIDIFGPSIIQNFENQMTSVEFWWHFWTQTMSKTLSYVCSFNPWTGHLWTNQLGWWVAKQIRKYGLVWVLELNEPWTQWHSLMLNQSSCFKHFDDVPVKLFIIWIISPKRSRRKIQKYGKPPMNLLFHDAFTE